MDYDYLIVGSGLFGCVFARELTNAGYKCLVIEKRGHIGGNIYTENIEGINVHKYGAHIFHTNDLKIWNYVNQFTEFNNYRHKVFVTNNNKVYSFPINLMTLNQLWGITNPDDAVQKLNSVKLSLNSPPNNLEDWILSQIGEELYELFIKGYTQKHWGRFPKNLPMSIIKRIPIRTNFDDFYFNDTYQGIPKNGYTSLILNLLRGIEVRTSIDFFKYKNDLSAKAHTIVYTGRIDELLDYEYGTLEYRSLKFVHEIIDKPDFQGTSVMNYTDTNTPFTRIIEHKHFEFGNQKSTIITKEFPLEWNKDLEPYYPINDAKNNNLYNQYLQKLKEKGNKFILGGRLAEYKYYDMHQVVGSAIAKAKYEINKRK